MKSIFVRKKKPANSKNETSVSNETRSGVKVSNSKDVIERRIKSVDEKKPDSVSTSHEKEEIDSAERYEIPISE